MARFFKIESSGFNTKNMNLKKTPLLISFLIILSSAWTLGNEPKNADKSETVKVIISGQTNMPQKEITVSWRDGLTALTALQQAATVSTHPVGNYVFVNTINDIKSERGVTAWYYTVNDCSTGTLAINFPVKPGDVINWIFKEDVCSPR